MIMSCLHFFINHQNILQVVTQLLYKSFIWVLLSGTLSTWLSLWKDHSLGENTPSHYTKHILQGKLFHYFLGNTDIHRAKVTTPAEHICLLSRGIYFRHCGSYSSLFAYPANWKMKLKAYPVCSNVLPLGPVHALVCDKLEWELIRYTKWLFFRVVLDKPKYLIEAQANPRQQFKNKPILIKMIRSYSTTGLRIYAECNSKCIMMKSLSYN